MIVWSSLSSNPNGIKLLEQNQDKISWSDISNNTEIFELDYNGMKKNNLEMEEDLIKEVMKPTRLFKMIEKYGDEYLELMFE